MNNFKNSSLLRTCCFLLLTFALVLGTQTNVFAQIQVQSASPSDVSAITTELQRNLNKLPDNDTRSKLSNSTKQLLDNTRALYQQGLQLGSMTASQQETWATSVSSNSASLQAAASTSCIQTCVNERETCIVNRCGNNTSFPCWCCIPCNIIFDLCVLDCLVDIEIGISIGKTAK